MEKTKNLSDQLTLDDFLPFLPPDDSLDGLPYIEREYCWDKDRGCYVEISSTRSEDINA